MMTARLRVAASAIGGIVAAWVAWELALLPIAGQLRLPPRPEVACDSAAGSAIATRQIEEGVAVARYSACGARLTGNPLMADAPWVVVLGDSYVAAREVNDRETVGSRLELLARTDGVPLNVRQYGWGGTGPGQYVHASRTVIGRWNPRRVVVLLSVDDFGADTLLGIAPRLRIRGSDYWVDTAGTPLGGVAGPAPASGARFLVRRRWEQIVARSPGIVRRALTPKSGGGDRWHMDENAQPAVVDAAVRALMHAYGDRLLMVYLSDVPAVPNDIAPAESMFVAACRQWKAPCVTMRDAMLRARERGVLARGFSTTVIGVGHLNPAGHDLVAREVWSAMRMAATR
jgi:hypothetical protein